MRTARALIVMPRSRSRSILSSSCSSISRWDTALHCSSRRSASVDLPWSICAIMEKFLICSRFFTPEAPYLFLDCNTDLLYHVCACPTSVLLHNVHRLRQGESRHFFCTDLIFFCFGFYDAALYCFL